MMTQAEISELQKSLDNGQHLAREAGCDEVVCGLFVVCQLLLDEVGELRQHADELTRTLNDSLREIHRCRNRI